MLVRDKNSNQGILKREVSLYHWPPVWLVWNRLYDNLHLFYFQNRQIQTSLTGGQGYSNTYLFRLLWFIIISVFETILEVLKVEEGERYAGQDVTVPGFENIPIPEELENARDQVTML